MKREIIDLKAMQTDADYEDRTVASVGGSETYWEIKMDNGVSFGLAKSYDVTPKPGDSLRMYPGGGLGTTIRGVALNGVPVYYRTAEEQAVRHKQQVAQQHEEERASYIANRAKYEAQLQALPGPFQERIIGFRNANPEFWEFEPYELFACTEAVKIAAKIPADKIQAFYKLRFEVQKKRVPDLDDGHSGGTFGAACTLARIYLTHPELLSKAHGAMCPLIGCKDYGCAASRGP